MKTIDMTSNYGNFAYRFTAEVGEEVNEGTTALCKQGLANIAYRVAGSYVDKKLGVKTGKGELGRKGVLYSPEDAERINAAVSEKLVELEKDEVVLKSLKLSFAVTGQHEFGAGNDAPTKEATEMWTKVQALVETDAEMAAGMVRGQKFATALKTLGLKMEDYTDEQGILACKARLTAAKQAAKVAAATALGM